MKYGKTMGLSLVIITLLSLYNSLIGYLVYFITKNPIVIIVSTSILVIYIIHKIFEVAPLKKLLISTVLISLIPIVLGTFREVVFILVSAWSTEDISTVLPNLREAYTFGLQYHMGSLISSIIPIMVSIGVIYILEKNKYNILNRKAIINFVLLLNILISSLSLGYIAYMYPFVGSFFTFLPVLLGILLIKKVYTLQSTRLSILYATILPILSTYFGLLIMEYFIRFSWEPQYVLTRMFASNDSTSLLIGLVSSVLIGVTLVFANQSNEEREAY